MRAVPVKEKSKLSYLPQKPLHTTKRRVIPLLILVLVSYFAIRFASQSIRMYQLRRTLVALNTQVETVKQENREMQAEIERLQSPEYLEQLAREQLGMVRSGELLFYFQNKDNPSAAE